MDWNRKSLHSRARLTGTASSKEIWLFARSEKFPLFVDDELLNPSIFIFIKIFLMTPGRFSRIDPVEELHGFPFRSDDVGRVLAENMTLDDFFDVYGLDKDNDIRTFLKTRLQLLIRSLNVASLQNSDFISRLLLSEHDMLTKAFQKLALPF